MVEPTRRGQPLGYALVAGLLIAPFLTLTWLVTRTSDRVSSLDVPPQAVYTQPTRETDADTRPVRIVATFGEAPSLRSPGISGVVTAVAISEGASVRSWDRILTVDGIDRIALATPQPLYRPLRLRSKGDDVLGFEQLLASEGLISSEPDGVVDRETERAIRSIEESLGIARPRGILVPDYVLWLPTEDMKIERVNVRTLDPAPSLGELVAQGPPSLLRLRLTDPSGSRIGELEAGAYTLVARGSELGAVENPNTLQPPIRQAFLQVLDDADGPISSDAPLQIDGVLRLVHPRRVTLLPTSSVMTDMSGTRTCVWIAEDGHHRPLSVTVAGESLGATEVLEELQDPTEVLVNPGEVLEAPQCPSP